MNYEIQNLPDFSNIWHTTLEWQPSHFQEQKFQQLYREILLANRQLNLTRITEPQDFLEKHLWDSLAGIVRLEIAKETENKRTLNVIDIGTGAGIPGIPVAIAFPEWNVTLLDSTRKKIAFLDHLLTKLDLKNTKTLIRRAEEIGREKLHREFYDLALIRAVGESSVCAEYTLPLLKVGGLAILYRGHWSQEDSSALEPIVTRLGGKIESVYHLVTPLSQSIRNWVYLRKLSPTSLKTTETQRTQRRGV